MVMSKATETVSMYTQSILPKEFTDGRRYIKLNDGMIKTITDAVFSTYPAKDKETKKPIIMDNGEFLLNHTVYIGFDDGTYTSVKSNTAVNQIASICEGFTIPTEVGIASYKTETTKVKVITVETKYGNKSFPTWAFDPIFE